MDFIERLNTYDKDHCWQYDIRLANASSDLEAAGLSTEYIATLRTSDFVFRSVTDKAGRSEMVEFIKRHEWLGTLSQYTTHWFGAYLEDTLAGVILMNMPNAFSKYLGDDTKYMERLISRGACISWSPKNLASAFLMWSIKWMVANTQYRLFTAYSDPSAKELGTIYQACNFYYTGATAGGRFKYINPHTGKLVSDRYFRQRTAYRRYAKELGIEWQKNWAHSTGMSWDNIPDDVESILRTYSKTTQANAERLEVPLKHKYAYVLGENAKETKALKKIFLENVRVYPYPKERGV